jgi:hypothetical protein
MRTTLKVVLLLACALLLAAPLLAQYNGGYTLEVPAIYAPEIHLGSAYQPTTVTLPSEAISANPPQSYVSNAPPANTELLATRHFDFITSPLDQAIPGSMEDTSISLGEYARQLRAEKQTQPFPPTAPNATAPNAIAAPPNRWR